MGSTEIQISSWDGTISDCQFRIAASAFAERWNKFNFALPQCLWIPSPTLPWLRSNSQEEGYLSVENLILPKECCKEGDDEGKEHFCCRDNAECVDSDILAPQPGLTSRGTFDFLDIRYVRSRTSQNRGALGKLTGAQALSYEGHFYDLHVVYSTSYRVPVLYFRGHCSDGQPLCLDDIEKDIPAYKASVLKDSKWTFITQEYHPYLNRPWYTLHPCGTSEFMKLLCTNQQASSQSAVDMTTYLVSWFSVVGQVFGLNIPVQMLASSSVPSS